MSSSMAEYLDAVGRIPMLTAAEEIELGNQVQAGEQLLEELAGATPDAGQARVLRRAKRAKDRMVSANLRLVVHMSKKYGGRGVDQLDLCQDGTLGLIRAVELFDPARGYKFSTYGYWWIRQAMQRAIDGRSRAIRVPVHLARLHRKLRGVIQQRQHLGTSVPTIAELAQDFAESEDRIRAALALEQPMASLSSRTRDDGSELGELLSCPGPTPDDVLRDSERLEALRDILNRAMSKMTPPQREVLRRRFALASEEPETLQAIGRALGLSRDRIKLYESKALATIKAGCVGVTELLRE